MLAEGRVLSVAELSNDRAASSSTASARRSRTSPRTRSSTSATRATSSPGASQIPDLRTEFRDRHALIVVRGTDYRRDLRALRPYIRDLRPVLVGVDGGGDALLEAGLKPDLVIGDMDSASDRVLTQRRGAGRARLPGRDARRGASASSASGSSTRCCRRPGTSEDVAMLVAFELRREPDRRASAPTST